MAYGYSDASLSGPRYGLARVTPQRTYRDITSSGPGYGVTPRPGAASPTGGYYSTALRNDPILQPYLGGLTTQSKANQVGLDTARSGLLAQYGAVPSNAVLGFNPSQEARDLANAATVGGVSTTARLAAAYGQQNANDAALAAAHGLAHSGYVGQYSQQNLNANAQQRYDALNALLGQLGQAQSGYLGQQAGLQDKAYQATSDALNRQIAFAKAGVGAPVR